MRPLRASDSFGDRLEPQISRQFGECLAVGLHPVCGRLQTGPQHHRRILTTKPVLLVRGTRQRSQPPNPGGVLDPGPKRSPNPRRPIGTVWVRSGLVEPERGMPHQIVTQVPSRCLSANSLHLSTSQYVSQTPGNGTYWDVVRRSGTSTLGLKNQRSTDRRRP
jgi:hypothetical protein